jgi:hypothetical protein
MKRKAGLNKVGAPQLLEVLAGNNKLTPNTMGVIRQHGKCSNRANTKQFPTMCCVCAKGRSMKEDVDMCRFEGRSKNVNIQIDGAVDSELR